VIDGCHVRCNIFLTATNIGSFDWTHTACKESKNKELLGLFDTVPTSLFVKGINPSAMDHQIKKMRRGALTYHAAAQTLLFIQIERSHGSWWNLLMTYDGQKGKLYVCR